MDNLPHDSLIREEKDSLIRFLNKCVIYSVKALAILIIFVLFWGLADVIVHIIQQFWLAPIGRFDVENLISTLGSFLAVLIVIEIFINIIFYLKKDAVHVPLVLATALTAVARKVIILDYSIAEPAVLYGIAAIVLAVGIVFWLVTKPSNS
jgi:uncharacterized membrane protein (DUF373 family)